MNQSVRILIIEDEILLSQDITIRLSKMGYMVVGAAQSYNQAVAMLNEETPDIAIVDIRIKGDKDGIEVGRYINENMDIPFIFLTSHADEQYVERAKAVSPYAYMLKPFNDREIQIAIEMALLNFSQNKPEAGISKQQEHDQTDNEVLPVKNSFFLKKDLHYEKVSFNDTLWLEAESNYTVFYTKNGKYIYSTVLKHIEVKLPQPQFLRVHRSYIVNVGNVTGFDRTMLYVGEKSVPVSKQYQEKVFNLFDTI